MIKRFLPLAFTIAAHAAMAADSSVPPFAKEDLVAFAGDSITSGGTYHKSILMGVAHYNASRIGKHWFLDRDIKAMADRGYDYIKADWKPNDVLTAERMESRGHPRVILRT
jgi:hypothetical protein